MLTEEQAVEQLEGFQVNEKKVALQALVIMGKVDEYSDEIAKLLDDEEAPVRKEAALTLGKSKPETAKRAQNLGRTLAASFADEDKGVRAEAARAIGALGREAALAIADRLVSVLSKDTDDEVLTAAVQCLAAVGEAVRLGPFLSCNSVAALRAALVEAGRSPEARLKHAELIADRINHKDTGVRLAAVQASGEVGSACQPQHLQALADLRSWDKQPKVRRGAVQSLGRAGAVGIPYLVSFFRDDDEGVRHFAGETLGGVGGEEAATTAAELLQDSDPRVRRAALLALGKMGRDGRDWSASICAHLSDEDHATRLAAIQALSELGASDEAAALGALCEDEGKGIRQAAVSALAKMKAGGAQQALRFLDDEDPAVRQAAVKVYSPLHSKLPAELALPHVQSVARKLVDGDWRVRQAAVVAMGDLHVGAYCDNVAAMCNDDNEQVRRSAITTLIKIGSSRAHIAAFLGDSDSGVMKEAERAYADLTAKGVDDGAASECD